MGGKGVLSLPRANKNKKLKVSNLVCQPYLRIFSLNFLTDNFPRKYQDLLARQN
jgi:hypothetical protein